MNRVATINLIIESMQPEGDGRLQQMFDELKMKLAGEGLFAQNLKKPLPDKSKMYWGDYFENWRSFI